MSGWQLLGYLAAGLIVYDMMRRSEAYWIAADRKRSSWITAAVVTGIFSPLALVTAVIYGVTVVPLLSEVAGRSQPVVSSKFVGR